MSADVLIVYSPYYEQITDMLMTGAQEVLESSYSTYEKLEVPGVLEIPGIIAMAQRPPSILSGSNYRSLHRGYLVLGCVIRGETGHYDIVATESSRAIMQLTIDHRLAVGNGILTVENESQALERADPTGKINKGGFAARAVLRMMEHRRKFRV